MESVENKGCCFLLWGGNAPACVCQRKGTIAQVRRNSQNYKCFRINIVYCGNARMAGPGPISLEGGPEEVIQRAQEKSTGSVRRLRARLLVRPAGPPPVARRGAGRCERRRTLPQLGPAGSRRTSRPRPHQRAGRRCRRPVLRTRRLRLPGGTGVRSRLWLGPRKVAAQASPEDSSYKVSNSAFRIPACGAGPSLA